MSTKQFRTVNRIPASIRWCLSGTPIQNTLMDLGALITFLGVPILSEPAVFRKYIMRSASTRKEGGSYDYKNLRALLGSICLRRNKAILPLYGLKPEMHKLELSTPEREMYHRLELMGRKAIDIAVSGHHTKEAHQSVIQSLLRLRMFCNNGAIEAHDQSSSLSGDPEEILSMFQQSGKAICMYCSCDILSMGILGSLDSVILTKCFHLVCGECRILHHHEEADLERISDSKSFLSSDRSNNSISLRSNLLEEKDESGCIQLDLSFPSKLKVLVEDVLNNRLREKRLYCPHVCQLVLIV